MKGEICRNFTCKKPMMWVSEQNPSHWMGLHQPIFLDYGDFFEHEWTRVILHLDIANVQIVDDIPLHFHDMWICSFLVPEMKMFGLIRICGSPFCRGLLPTPPNTNQKNGNFHGTWWESGGTGLLSHKPEWTNGEIPNFMAHFLQNFWSQGPF